VQHVDHLLAEYYDHELSARRCKHVENHLAACPACRESLERLRLLTGTLAECVLPETLTRAEQFRARVALKLPRRDTAPRRSISWTWLLVPVGLLCVLVMIQGLWLLSNSVDALYDFLGWGGVDVLASVSSAWSLSPWAEAVLTELGRLQVLDVVRVVWQILLWDGCGCCGVTAHNPLS
jgi:predicted anti-sigma-YlaC factor YlaD